MPAYELTDKVIEALKIKAYQTMILNYANPDMVGHTGDIEATKKAVKVTVECVGKVTDFIINELGGVAIILADHGNAEQMRDSEGKPHTAHTTNEVPVVITKKGIEVNHGSLCDVAPTLLDLLAFEKQPSNTSITLT